MGPAAWYELKAKQRGGSPCEPTGVRVCALCVCACAIVRYYVYVCLLICEWVGVHCSICAHAGNQGGAELMKVLDIRAAEHPSQLYV